MEELLVGVFLEGNWKRVFICVYKYIYIDMFVYIYIYTCLYIYIYIYRSVVLYTLFLPVGLIAYSEQKERKDINEFSHIDPPIRRKDAMRAMVRS